MIDIHCAPMMIKSAPWCACVYNRDLSVPRSSDVECVDSKRDPGELSDSEAPTSSEQRSKKRKRKHKHHKHKKDKADGKSDKDKYVHHLHVYLLPIVL